ncbi:MAG: hypothetical protein PW786_04685 [Arachidicoccus sp.]|nr:hypothetical protein [Arachidicoccus sp.]
MKKIILVFFMLLAIATTSKSTTNNFNAQEDNFQKIVQENKVDFNLWNYDILDEYEYRFHTTCHTTRSLIVPYPLSSQEEYVFAEFYEILDCGDSGPFYLEQD